MLSLYLSFPKNYFPTDEAIHPNETDNVSHVTYVNIKHTQKTKYEGTYYALGVDFSFYSDRVKKSVFFFLCVICIFLSSALYKKKKIVIVVVFVHDTTRYCRSVGQRKLVRSGFPSTHCACGYGFRSNRILIYIFFNVTITL